MDITYLPTGNRVPYFTEVYQSLPKFTEVYQSLPKFTEFYWSSRYLTKNCEQPEVYCEKPEVYREQPEFYREKPEVYREQLEVYGSSPRSSWKVTESYREAQGSSR